MKGYGWQQYIEFKNRMAEGRTCVARVRVPRMIGKVLLFGPKFTDEDRRRELLANSDPMDYGKANGYRVYCLYEGYGLTAYDEEQYDGDFKLYVHDEMCRMADWYVENCLSPGARQRYRDDVVLRESFQVDPETGLPSGAIDHEYKYLGGDNRGDDE